MKQLILPVFAIASLIAGPLMAQSAVESGMAGHHGSSAPTMQGSSVGCMDKMAGLAQHMEDRMASMRSKLKITDEQMPQ
jgi:hypothetical protein